MTSEDKKLIFQWIVAFLMTGSECTIILAVTVLPYHGYHYFLFNLDNIRFTGFLFFNALFLLNFLAIENFKRPKKTERDE